jgi:hypothetical protein
MLSDPHVITHQYAHLFLQHVNPTASGSATSDPVEAALADYFACSFDGDNRPPTVLTAEVPPGVLVGRRELDREILWDTLPEAATDHQ